VRTPLNVAVVLECDSGVDFVRALEQIPKASIRWICDRRLRRDEFAWAPGARLTTHVDEVLEDEEVDAVIVSADEDDRREIAARALGADKHVLVEGAIASDAEAAERLVREAHRRQRVLTSAHRAALHSATRELKTFVSLGRLGEVYYLRALRNATPHSQEDLWSLVAEEAARVLHVLEDEPVEVFARGDSYGGADVEVACCLLRFATGIAAQIDVSMLDVRPLRRLAVVASDVTAVLDELAPCALTIHDARTADVFSPHVECADPALEACRSFLTSLRATGQPAPPREEVVVVAVVDALRRSLAADGAASPPAALQPGLRVLGAESAEA
jgi:predicted dehydrogenase